ncbi:MAG: hypothetical protein PHS44_01790 [Candidatus Dojkabacteria bacterium]|nr:hypothetical protein [Candidatus Dojkabacteria bacterium]
MKIIITLAGILSLFILPNSSLVSSLNLLERNDQEENGEFIDILGESEIQIQDEKITLLNKEVPNTSDVSGDQYISSIKDLEDNSYIMAGGDLIGRGRAITKLDEFFQTVWSKQYAFTSDTYIHDMEVLSDGNYLVAGRRGVSGNTKYLYFIVDGSGNFISGRTITTGANNYLNKIKKLRNDNIIAAGYGNWGDMPLVLFDQSGNVIWREGITVISNYSNNYISAIEEADDGNILIGGSTQVSTSDRYAYITKINATDGSIIWSRAFTGGGSDSDMTQQIKAHDGYVFAFVKTGKHDTEGGFDIMLVKLDSSGNLIQSKTLGGAGNEAISGADVLELDDGTLLAAAQTNSGLIDNDFFLFNFTNDLDILSLKIYSNPYGDDTIKDLFDLDNSSLLLGSFGEESTANDDVFVLNFDDSSEDSCLSDFSLNEGDPTSLINSDVTATTIVNSLGAAVLAPISPVSDDFELRFLCGARMYEQAGRYMTLIEGEETIFAWDRLSVVNEIPSKTDIKYSIFDNTCNTILLGPLTFTGDIELSGIDAKNHSTLCMEARLETSEVFTSPSLNNWRANYYVEADELEDTGATMWTFWLLGICLVIISYPNVKKVSEVNPKYIG